MKKTVFSILIFLLAASFFLFIYKHQKKTAQAPVDVTPFEHQVTFDDPNLTTYDETLHFTVQEALIKQQAGYLVDGYLYDDHHYITLSQTKTRTYDNQFRGDIVSWITVKGKDVTIERLGSGELASLIEENHSPFIQVGSDKLVMFYERSFVGKNGENLKGYVYQIKGDKLNPLFQTTGSYYDSGRDQNGNLLLIDQVYDDPTGYYPLKLRPYLLHYESYQHGKFVEVKRERITPKK